MSQSIRVEIARKMRDLDADAIYGTVTAGDRSYATCERGWHDNQAGLSCVPPGFYVLEYHNGTKYHDTFALIGETVTHNSTPGFPRSACVVHWEDDGLYLKGCVSIGDHVEWYPDRTSKLVGNKVEEFLNYLKQFDEIHLTISDPT